MNSQALYKAVRTRTGPLVVTSHRGVSRAVRHRYDLFNEGAGFDWSNLTRATEALAVAILADFAGDDLALIHAKAFRELLALMPVEGFELTGEEISGWLRHAEAEAQKPQEVEAV